MTITDTTTVSTEDLWQALEALSYTPEATESDWYKRLERAANLATQQEALDKGVIDRH